MNEIVFTLSRKDVEIGLQRKLTDQEFEALIPIIQQELDFCWSDSISHWVSDNYEDISSGILD